MTPESTEPRPAALMSNEELIEQYSVAMTREPWNHPPHRKQRQLLRAELLRRLATIAPTEPRTAAINTVAAMLRDWTSPDREDDPWVMGEPEAIAVVDAVLATITPTEPGRVVISRTTVAKMREALVLADKVIASAGIQ